MPTRAAGGHGSRKRVVGSGGHALCADRAHRMPTPAGDTVRRATPIEAGVGMAPGMVALIRDRIGGLTFALCLLPSPMTRIQRRLLIDTSVIGITLTLFVVILDYTTHTLQPLEDWFYDRRARWCQFFTPKPTDKLIHIDIDDSSIDAVGKWPWPRAIMAELIDEIDRAGASAISMDIIYSEPSEPRYLKLGPGRFKEIDDDALFADALRRSGRCLVP